MQTGMTRLDRHSSMHDTCIWVSHQQTGVALLYLQHSACAFVLHQAPRKKTVPKVAHQGCAGAYSEVAARRACPEYEPLPCEQFEVAFQVRAALRA